MHTGPNSVERLCRVFILLSLSLSLYLSFFFSLASPQSVHLDFLFLFPSLFLLTCLFFLFFFHSSFFRYFVIPVSSPLRSLRTSLFFLSLSLYCFFVCFCLSMCLSIFLNLSFACRPPSMPLSVDLVVFPFCALIRHLLRKFPVLSLFVSHMVL